MPEKILIDGIRKQAARSRSVRGGIAIGDDCAVLQIPRGHEALVTTDFSLENVHFKRAWHSAESVGHRCLVRGLSDIAAMGGQPLAAFLSLAVPAELPQKWVDGFLHGLLRLADEFKVTLAGGDTAASPAGILADIAVLGSVPNGRAVLRSGAQAGDRIYVTGKLGASAATLDLLRSGKKLQASQFAPHFYPTPRIAIGRYLRERGLASAMIDISDGISTDLDHICKESKVGAEIDAAAIPLARFKVGDATGKKLLGFALNGGEDYELLFTAGQGKSIPRRIAGVDVTPIGVVTRGRKVLLQEDGRRRELLPQGWEHFRKKKK